MMRIELEDGDSQLFLVRLWREGEDAPLGADEGGGVHGRVQHILSGTAQSFEEWPALIDFLLNSLPQKSPQVQIGVSALRDNA